MAKNKSPGFTDLFVGRKSELQILHDALAESMAGHPCVVAVSGEPGIGKSAMLDFFAGICREKVCVLRGRCSHGEGAPPYYPWRQIVLSYITDCDAKWLWEELGMHAHIIAEVVDESRAMLGEFERPVRLEDPGSARFRFNQSVVTLFRKAASSQPLLIVLDDIHWADSASMALLSFLIHEAESAPILTVISHRLYQPESNDLLRRTLGNMARHPRYERIDLGGLKRTDVQQYVQMGTGQRPSPEDVDALYRKTAGNPLFVRELTRMLHKQRQIGVAADGRRVSFGIPATLVDLIHGWLDDFSEDCLAVLSMAAALGMDIRIGMLSFCIERPRVQV